MTLQLSIFGLIGIYLGVQTLFVVLNTLKAIWQIKAGKMLASISSAVCYGVYVFVLIFTTTDFGTGFWGDTIIKAVLTFITNFVGTWLGMRFLERIRKDRLWKIEATVNAGNGRITALMLDENEIMYNYLICANGDIVFNIYSQNKKDSEKIKIILEQVDGKYTIYENQIRL